MMGVCVSGFICQQNIICEDFCADDDDDNEQKLAECIKIQWPPHVENYTDKKCSFESKIACLKMCGFLNHPNGI